MEMVIQPSGTRNVPMNVNLVQTVTKTASLPLYKETKQRKVLILTEKKPVWFLKHVNHNRLEASTE